MFVTMADRRAELDGTKWHASAPPPASPQAGRGEREWSIRFSRPIAGWRREERARAELAPHIPAHRLDALPAGGGNDLSANERLAQVLRYTLLPLRWEPRNYSGEHRGVPSAGGLFSTETFLLVRHGGTSRAFHVSPANMGLVEIDLGGLRGPAEDSVRLITIARLARLAADYAEFGAGLAALEAGMIHAQLALLCHRLGLATRSVHALAGDAAALARLCPHWSDVPVACVEVDIDVAAWVRDIDTASIVVAIEEEDHASAERLPRLRELTDAIRLPPDEEGAAMTPPFRAAASLDGFPLFASIARRTSGYLTGTGAPRLAVEPDEAQELFETACRLFSRLSTEQPVVSVALKSGKQQPVSLFRLDVAKGALHPAPAGSFGLSMANQLCSGDVTAIATLGVDERALFDAIDAGCLRRLFLTIGGIAQCICLAAAERGYFARPSRAEPDSGMNLLLPIDASGMLQILIGRNVMPGLAFPLQ